MITQEEKKSFFRHFQRLKTDVFLFEAQRERSDLIRENCRLNNLIDRAQQLDLYDLSGEDDEVDQMHQLRTRVREILLNREYRSMCPEQLAFPFSPRIRFASTDGDTQTGKRSVSPEPFRPVSKRDQFMRDFWLLERDVADFRQQSNLKRFTSSRIDSADDLNDLNRCMSHHQAYNRDLTALIARIDSLEQFDLSNDDDGHLIAMRVRRNQLHDDLNLLTDEIERRYNELQYYLRPNSSRSHSLDSHDVDNSRHENINKKPIKTKKRTLGAVSHVFLMRAMAHPAMKPVVAVMFCVTAGLAFSFGHTNIGYASLLCGLGLFASSARDSCTWLGNLFSPLSSPTSLRH